MAGDIVPMPANGAADWSDFVVQVEKQRTGYQSISLTNFGNDNEPEIAAGSICEIGGSVAKFDINEAITGWGVIGNDNDVYIKLVPAAPLVTAEFTTVAPTWSDAKQGWYGAGASATHRYIGGLYKNAGGNYTNKYVFASLNQNSKEIKVFANGRMEIPGLRTHNDSTHPFLQTKIIEIGDWNMDTTPSKTVAHGLTGSHIRGWEIYIRRDADEWSDSEGLNKFSRFFGGLGLYSRVGNTDIFMDRDGGSLFDSIVYNATPYNRGWIFIWYDPDG